MHATFPTRTPSARLLLTGLLLASQSATATNDALQGLFFAACNNPTGALAERCAQTTDGLGNLSGDSETSLNPSQVLSGHQQGTRELLSRNQQGPSEEHNEEAPATTIEIGDWALGVSAGRSWESFDREQDVDNERSYDADGSWAALTLDYSFSADTQMGFMLSAERDDLTYGGNNVGRNFTPPNSAGRVESDAIGGGLFLTSWLTDHVYVDAKVGMSQGDRKYRRNSVFQESNRVVAQTNSVTEGETDIESTWASIAVGADWQRGAWTLGASAELSYVSTEIDAFDEKDLSNTGLAMHFDAAKQSSDELRINLSAQRAISTDFGVVVPFARVGFIGGFNGDEVKISSRYLLDGSNNELEVVTDEADESYYVGNLGVTLVMPNGWMGFIEGEYWGGYEDLHRGSISIGIRAEL